MFTIFGIMFLTFVRFLILSICLGAASLASASTHINENVQQYVVHNTVNQCNEMVVQSHSVNHNADVAPLNCNENQIVKHSSGNEHQLIQSNNSIGLPVSVNNSKFVWNFPISKPNKSSDKNKQHRIEFSDYNIALGTSSRLLNALHLNPEEVSPEYRLAFELPILVAVPLTLGYQEPLSPTVEWILKIKSSSSRISGWKDTNLIYSQYGEQLQVV
ncbi:hypothetical protein [Photobacterium sp. GB-1]|uniref:hypothetical protein n=1 Tax=Photobacterium sp. GB-1 TaxID=2022111 RepID=UPI001E54F904|nr:hypothetical protein [Photobacterium sp. GB-1]